MRDLSQRLTRGSVLPLPCQLLQKLIRDQKPGAMVFKSKPGRVGCRPCPIEPHRHSPTLALVCVIFTNRRIEISVRLHSFAAQAEAVSTSSILDRRES